MQVVDAVWEQRNLGVSCVEVTLRPEDTLAAAQDSLSKLNAQYQVVKVQAGRADLMFRLSELGFHFIEATVHITRKVADLELSGIEKRLAACVTYAPMEDADLPVLWNEIRGGMYDTDRVFLDPRFTAAQASNRYIGWIQDEMARGTDVYKLIYKNEAIGYFTMKDLGDGVYYPFLAGLYRDHRTSGLGFNIAYQPMREVAARGGTSISTYISTNNDSAVRLHALLGFRFNEITYVYVKHGQ